MRCHNGVRALLAGHRLDECRLRSDLLVHLELRRGTESDRDGALAGLDLRRSRSGGRRTRGVLGEQLLGQLARDLVRGVREGHLRDVDQQTRNRGSHSRGGVGAGGEFLRRPTVLC